VETVKGYAKQEKDVLISVTEARSKVGGAGTVSDKIKANNELTGALSRLMVVVEKYPDLKSNQNFLALQDELAGTENRIAVERKRYNETAQMFNSKLRQFPYYFAANRLGMKKAPYYESEAGAKVAPQVKF
jgi:LemA protein